MNRLCCTSFVPLAQVKELARKHREMIQWDEEIVKVEILFGESWAACKAWFNHSEIMFTLK